MVYGLALCGGALSLNADSVLDQSELTLHKVVFVFVLKPLSSVDVADNVTVSYKSERLPVFLADVYSILFHVGVGGGRGRPARGGAKHTGPVCRGQGGARRRPGPREVLPHIPAPHPAAYGEDSQTSDLRHVSWPHRAAAIHHHSSTTRTTILKSV